MDGGSGGETVTVVMTAYECAPYVDEALRSLAGQTRPPDQVVVVDDHSCDDTVARVRAWCDDLPIHLVSLDRNVGCGMARAHAMHLAGGDLVCFLDADDVLLPTHLEHLTATWRAHGGAVSPRALVWRPGEILVDYHRVVGLHIPRRAQLARLLADNFVFYGALFPRDAYRQVGGIRPVRHGDDWDLWVRMAAAGTRFTVAEEPTVLYRRHPGNLTGDVGPFDLERVRIIEQFRREHPEWLSTRAWAGVLRHRRTMARVHRGLARIHHGELAGVRDLVTLAGGGRRSVAQVARQTAYRSYRAATFRTAVRLR